MKLDEVGDWRNKIRKQKQTKIIKKA